MATIRMTIEGMNCDNCRKRVEKALAATEGVEGASVDLARKEATVTGSADAATLKAAVEKAGYKVA